MNAVAWGTMFSVLACIVLGILLKLAYDAIDDLRRKLNIVEHDTRVNGYYAGRHSSALRSPVMSTPFLEGACNVCMENGTLVVRLLDGELLPKQTRVVVEHDMPDTASGGLPVVTVTMFANLSDSVPRKKTTTPTS